MRLTAESIMRSFRISGKRRMGIIGGNEQLGNILIRDIKALPQADESQCEISYMASAALDIAQLDNSDGEWFIYDMDEPVLPIGCVIMASGYSRRFGSNKLLAELHGRPMLCSILESSAGNLFAARIAVTRYAQVAEICRDNGCPALVHELPLRSDTVRLGLNELIRTSPRSLAGCMFCQSDQPMLSRESLETLCLTFSHSPDKICRLSYGATAGSPVLFPGAYFGELMSLPDGKGGSFLTAKYSGQVKCVPAKSSDELRDVDTPQELNQLRQPVRLDSFEEK